MQNNKNGTSLFLSKILLTVTLGMIIGGCASSTQPKVQQQEQKQAIHQAMRQQQKLQRVPKEQKPYKAMGEQKATPQLLKEMEQEAKKVQGVENARVSIREKDVYVTLDLKPKVTAAEARKIEHHVIDALHKKSKRYDFHVTSYDGHHS
ncbi:hypothetical protein EGH10_00330 [Brevibacillus laterosporus]|uniref:Sporulation lipoprotein n=1 Tax=Brevibacillus laterosporus LMG 15441 TaxID=1042163 RepID=A0A075RBW8_BRELA|nr:YhcN/YlaJ family sporulation lipoprotein [Brevibacillus laterosporus]AIG28718.1 sporulation lipoprotein [Brevibacillus laterosporus LMG 15441]RJL11963.1 hypothetical protein DM460_09350 [Brevibacillus laterosporus]TPH19596.1 hypothetical protein EGH10_00330 [Brevibacillus laterosporus]